MLTRNAKLLCCIDPATQSGLEVGPLATPIVTREMGSIRYVDYATSEQLKAKYTGSPNVDTSRIVEVDYVWGVQSLPELAKEAAPFDYAIASHVIEHVPDFISWLQEMRAVLKPGGILSLAIPDKQFCFDYYRHVTKPADVIESYLRRSRKPSPRQIFDYLSSAVSRQGMISWDTAVNDWELTPIHSESEAWKMAYDSFISDSYLDAHCWVFTPSSFLRLLKSLMNLELFDFKIVQFYETAGSEFFVSLEALDSHLDKATLLQHQLSSLPNIPLQPSEAHTSA
ncbi:MAG TPA: methyltransferase domain-containing protein [Coleofasciculaceae cyanobacterium]